MSSGIRSLHATLNLNTRLFISALDDVDDSVAVTRPNQNTNHMAFIACHLLDARYYLADYLRCPTQNPFKDILAGAKTIEDIRSAWKEVSGLLGARLPKLDDETLRSESPQPFPIDDPTVLGGITFLLEHESHHIGQLAYLRRFFGLASMSWSTIEEGE